MKMIVVAGTVLNQDTGNPMSGRIIESGNSSVLVSWCNGLVNWEYRGDVTLTGDVEFEEINDDNE